MSRPLRVLVWFGYLCLGGPVCSFAVAEALRTTAVQPTGVGRAISVAVAILFYAPIAGFLGSGLGVVIANQADEPRWKAGVPLVLNGLVIAFGMATDAVMPKC